MGVHVPTLATSGAEDRARQIALQLGIELVLRAPAGSQRGGTVWSTGGCRSWYLDEHGVNRTLWSGMTWQYWLATRSLDLDEYRLIPSN